MIPFFAVLALPAIAAACWIGWKIRPSLADWRKIFLPRIAFLVTAGLIAGAPFLSSRGLGTGEAYNYSLATADAVTQFRTGVFPILVGQTEFAWNGRIHPLRTAPYLAHFAAALDLLTSRTLNFWALQNLTLALSFMGAVFACYSSLRRVAAVDAKLALILSAAYVLAPAALAAAYSMDLYMTVLTLPFIPVSLMAAQRASRELSPFRPLCLLAGALAAAWLAHPPVALWLSVSCMALLFPLVSKVRAWPALIGAGLLGAVLVQFVFVSVLSIEESASLTNARTVGLLVSESQRVFSASIHPVSALSNQLGDFQLGYAYWLILFIAVSLAIVRKSLGALTLVGMAVLLLVLTIPSGLQIWLWNHLPAIFVTLTNQWPMQRTYLLIVALVIFAFSQTFRIPKTDGWPRWLRDLGALALLAVGIWTAHESWKFIRRGFAVTKSPAESALLHRSENLDLTVTSFAILGAPPWYTYGVMDPNMELRVLRRGDTKELSSNWTAISDTPATIRGTFRQSLVSSSIAVLDPKIKISPNQHYYLNFDFLGASQSAVLQIRGDGFMREYPLGKTTGGGFGFQPSGRHALVLWTTEKNPIELSLQLVSPELAKSGKVQFAQFSLTPIDPQNLPVRVDALAPLRLAVKVTEPAYLETARGFIPGYTATVNGQSVYVRKSPTGLVMIPIPAGSSQVELTYRGSLLLRQSFWLGAMGWIGFFSLGFIRLAAPRSLDVVASSLLAPVKAGLTWSSRRWISISVAVVLAATIFFSVQRYRAWRNAVGPLRVKILLSLSEVGRSQPLLTTGKPNAGTFLFLVLSDATHVKVGMDVWGLGYWESEPIAIDYYAVQEFVISSGALYPPGHPRLAGLSETQIKELRDHITVDLNGQRVLDQKFFSFDSTRADVTVGLNRIGGSHAEPRLVAEIISTERLPVPTP